MTLPHLARHAARRHGLYLMRFARDAGGVAAPEFALIGGLFVAAMLNVVDIARYGSQLMALETATQSGANEALVTCDTKHIPATVNCPGLNAAVNGAVQSTSLGNKISLSGPISEAYYCLNPSGSLQYVADVAHKPADCSAAGNAGLKPADYLIVKTTLVYAPIFPGVTVVSGFAGPISKSAWMRVG